MQIPRLSVGKDVVTLTVPRDGFDKSFQGYMATPNEDLRLDGFSVLGRWAGATNTWFEVARFGSNGLDQSLPVGDRLYSVSNYDFINSGERNKLGVNYEEVRAKSWHEKDVLERAGILESPTFTH